MKELSEKGEKREKRERERSSIRRYTIHTHQHIIFFLACLLLSFFLFTFLTSSLRTIDTSPPSGLLYPDSSTLLYSSHTLHSLAYHILPTPPHLSLPPVSLHPPRKGEHRGPEKVKRDIGRGKKRKEKRKKGKREGEKTKKKKKETLYPRTIAALLLRCT